MEKALKNARSQYTLIGSGNNRTVFEYDEGRVIKLPHNECGIEDNYSEARRFKKYGKDKDLPYAAWDCGLRLLRLELVELYFLGLLSLIRPPIHHLIAWI